MANKLSKIAFVGLLSFGIALQAKDKEQSARSNTETQSASFSDLCARNNPFFFSFYGGIVAGAVASASLASLSHNRYLKSLAVRLKKEPFFKKASEFFNKPAADATAFLAPQVALNYLAVRKRVKKVDEDSQHLNEDDRIKLRKEVLEDNAVFTRDVPASLGLLAGSFYSYQTIKYSRPEIFPNKRSKVLFTLAYTSAATLAGGLYGAVLAKIGNAAFYLANRKSLDKEKSLFKKVSGCPR